MLKLRLAARAASLGLALVVLSPGGAAAASGSDLGGHGTNCPSQSSAPHVDTIGGQSVNDVAYTDKCTPTPSASASASASTSMSARPSSSPSTKKPTPGLASSGSVDLPLLCALCALLLVAGTLTLTRSRLRPRSATRRGTPGRHV